MINAKIIDYEKKYKPDFIRISMEWLKKYDLLEEEDLKILNNPEEEVLNSGGHIFFAQFGEEIGGTAALIKVDKDTFELAKLAVAEEYQHEGIGRMLMDKCLETARQENMRKIMLYSNHKLEAAIGLYKRLGFKEIPYDMKKYDEADMMMELWL